MSLIKFHEYKDEPGLLNALGQLPAVARPSLPRLEAPFVFRCPRDLLLEISQPFSLQHIQVRSLIFLWKNIKQWLILLKICVPSLP